MVSIQIIKIIFAGNFHENRIIQLPIQLFGIPYLQTFGIFFASFVKTSFEGPSINANHKGNTPLNLQQI